jgi:Ca2+/Na+ antiporter
METPRPKSGFLQRDVVSCIMTAALVIGTWGLVMVQHFIEESGPRNFLAVASVNIPQYFIIAAIFLAAPFIGLCSAIRVLRRRDRSMSRFGWAFAICFGSFLLFSCLVYCAEYQRYNF